MAKEEWGTKRMCPETGKRFYDLNNSPVISPYTGKEIMVDKFASEKTKITKKNEEIKLNVIIDLTLIGPFSYQFKIN